MKEECTNVFRKMNRVNKINKLNSTEEPCEKCQFVPSRCQVTGLKLRTGTKHRYRTGTPSRSSNPSDKELDIVPLLLSSMEKPGDTLRCSMAHPLSWSGPLWDVTDDDDDYTDDRDNGK